jgi:hypothetical protein
MASSILTLTNNSGAERFYGGTRIANAGSFVIEDGGRTSLLEDGVFLTDLTATDAVVDNGVFDLNEAVTLRALRSEQAVIIPSWHASGDVTVGSFLKGIQLPPGVGEYKASFTGYISEAVTSQLGILAFEVQILINAVTQATIVVPAGAPQDSIVTTLQIPVSQEDSVSIKVNSGAPSDPIVRLTLQDW